jgi:Icc protein
LAPQGFPALQRLGEWDLVLIDTSWPGHDDGRAGPEQLEWLDAHLASGEGPAMVALHHPPLSPCDDPDCKLSDGDELLRILDRHGRARVVLSGHTHRPFDRAVGRTMALGAPSTCRQIHHQAGRHAWTNEGPAGRFLTLYPDGHLSHRLAWTREPAVPTELEWWDR